MAIPAGYIIPPATLSPDHRLGVLVPLVEKMDSLPTVTNSIVEISTGRIVAPITGEAGWSHALNHLEAPVARWAIDGSALAWLVDDKWSPATLAIVRLARGKVLWQVDALSLGQQAILKWVRNKQPDRYAAIKKEHTGWGSAYPDGETVEVYIPGAANEPLTFPVPVRVDLTSNPKGVGIDKAGRLDAQLEADVDASGAFTVRDVHMGYATPPVNWLP